VLTLSRIDHLPGLPNHRHRRQSFPWTGSGNRRSPAYIRCRVHPNRFGYVHGGKIIGRGHNRRIQRGLASTRRTLTTSSCTPNGWRLLALLFRGRGHRTRQTSHVPSSGRRRGVAPSRCEQCIIERYIALQQVCLDLHLLIRQRIDVRLEGLVTRKGNPDSMFTGRDEQSSTPASKLTNMPDKLTVHKYRSPRRVGCDLGRCQPARRQEARRQETG
jgi:hypothetical protein